mmetsp:Transcript_44141/g.116827  ORF Transcript_44141/g.116827 Transcript_44141/m.116827 type:complete len:209 (+) Transcript_44141:5000-5626(+)
MAAGSAISKSLMSFSSLIFSSASFASDFSLSSSANSCTLATCPLSFVSSAWMLVCSARTRGDSLDNSVTVATADGPALLPSSISFVSVACNSREDAKDLLRSSLAAATISSEAVMLARTALALPNDFAAACSTATTISEDFFDLPPAAGVSVSVPVPAAPLPPAMPSAGSTNKRPGSTFSASHGILQPALGGVMLADAQRAHTCEPPI